jgi:hypothetical protein
LVAPIRGRGLNAILWRDTDRTRIG